MASSFATTSDGRWESRVPAVSYLIATVLFLAFTVAYYPLESSLLKAQILAALAAAVVILQIFRNENFLNRRQILLYVCTGVFLALVYIHQIYRPPITEYAASKFENLAFSLIFFLMLAPTAFSREPDGRILVYSISAFSLLYCLANFTPSMSSANLRYSAIGLSPTMMGKVVLIVGIFSLVARKTSVWSSILAFAIVAISLWSSIRTGSRGPVLALIVSYGALLFLRNGIKGLGRYIIYLPVALVIIVLALQFMPEEIASRFTLGGVSIASNSDEGDRVFLWNLALVGLQHSWTGYGLGNYSAATFLAAPHNIVLESAYELGVWLSFLYVYIVFYPAFLLKRLAEFRYPVYDFFIVTYLMMLITSLISGEMTLTSALLYVAAGAIWGFSANLRSPSDREIAS